MCFCVTPGHEKYQIHNWIPIHPTVRHKGISLYASSQFFSTTLSELTHKCTENSNEEFYVHNF